MIFNCLPNVLNKVCESFLTYDERIYYSKEWSHFIPDEALIIAAKNNWIDLLQWENSKWFSRGHYRLNINIMTRKLYSIAAKNGHLDVLQWIETNIYTHNENMYYEICCVAARNNHLNVLKWANRKGHKMTGIICNIAAAAGNLDMFKWLVQKCTMYYNYNYDPYTWRKVAFNGHIDILKFIHKKGYRWSPIICQSAQAGKHWDILDWLREHACKCGGKYHLKT